MGLEEQYFLLLSQVPWARRFVEAIDPISAANRDGDLADIDVCSSLFSPW
jgi:hypothetical protein